MKTLRNFELTPPCYFRGQKTEDRLCELSQNLYALLNLFIAGGVAYSKVRVFFAKDIARNYQHIVFNCLFHERRS